MKDEHRLKIDHLLMYQSVGHISKSPLVAIQDYVHVGFRLRRQLIDNARAMAMPTGYVMSSKLTVDDKLLEEGHLLANDVRYEDINRIGVG